MTGDPVGVGIIGAGFWRGTGTSGLAGPVCGGSDLDHECAKETT
jgi:hypothetical protein